MYLFLSGKEKPQVAIHVLPKDVIEHRNSDDVTLVCLVSSPVQHDYYIAWSEHSGQNTGLYTDGINFPPKKVKDGYLVTSVYTTSKSKWKTQTFKCSVLQAGSHERTVQNASEAQQNSCEC